MPIEDVFGIKGRGTVVTGRVERGIVKTGEEVEIVGFGETRKTVCTGVEMFRKLLDQGEAGDNVGCLLRGVEREDVERGQVLAKPGSITPHTEFEAEVYCLSKDEGGRHTPFFNGYRPQFYIRTTDVTGSIQLPEGVEMVMPGDNIKMTSELITPVALEEGVRFAIREGGRTVGAGVSDEGAEVGTTVAKKEDRVVIDLACTSAGSGPTPREKNRRNDPDRIELRKYCPRCRQHRVAQRGALGELMNRAVRSDSSRRSRRQKPGRALGRPAARRCRARRHGGQRRSGSAASGAVRGARASCWTSSASCEGGVAVPRGHAAHGGGRGHRDGNLRRDPGRHRHRLSAG